ncbi:MAG: hypothetical protein LUB59_03320, partial [Candidatus Gastranaerophilales bacterium]|nr:hypothetical protein [Candidatus Gastranaerophilales bacterium]
MDDAGLIPHNLMMFFVFLFYATLFIYLVYPTFRVYQLWNPPVPTSELIYAKTAASKSSSVLSLCSTLNIIAQPFFFVYLKEQLDEKKIAKFILLVLIWMYLDYLQNGYI